jgi:hypothetical protein
MHEIKIGGVEFTDNTANNNDPHIIAVFGEEHSGKTRLALSGPSGVGCIVTEMKSYKTLDKDSQELGKRIFKPKDPLALMAIKRKADTMQSDVARQLYYKEVTKKIEQTTYALLEHKEVKLLMFDKFTHYCLWKEFAINGMSENFVKIEGKLVQRKAEVTQAIIDFLTDLSQFGKPVLLLCSAKPDFDVVDKDKKPLRSKENCGSFYYLGSHVNLSVETVNNALWKPDSEKENEKWRYRLNVRQAQLKPNLQGPEGNPLLEDDQITLANLINMVDDNCDLDEWM